MNRHPFIAIEGAIGVGKTTLARLLQPEMGGTILLEEFEENPFLSDFYADRARYAFQTQLFFLLSRYRQQLSTVTAGLGRGPVTSDYIFAKDSLFAHLNLSGDELAMYDRVYAALNEKIPTPDLLVFLRADLDVLMERIAARDRPYERDMDPDYIEELRIAYEEFVGSYDEAPVLVIDTNSLDFVRSEEDLTYVLQRIRSDLKFGVYQAQLPGVGEEPIREPKTILEEMENGVHSLADMQEFHLSLDAEKGFDPDPFINFIALNEEVGELAHALKKTWLAQAEYRKAGKEQREAQRLAVNKHRTRIQEELADCLAYLLKLSNYAGIDLEKAYIDKMEIVTNDQSKYGTGIKEAE
jgi:deoxyguanosine kinase